MNKNIFKFPAPKEVVIYGVGFLMSFLLMVSTYKFYDNKVKTVPIYNPRTKQTILIKEKDLSFMYLIDSFDKGVSSLLKLGKLKKLARSFKIPFFIVVKSKDANKLKAFCDLHSLDFKVFITDGLTFWKYSKGTEPTLSLFKRGRVVYAESGILDWNKEKRLKDMKKLIGRFCKKKVVKKK